MEITEKYGVIIYGDGSAGPMNPGPHASGIHGYVYPKSTEGTKNNNTPNHYLITNIGYVETTEIAKEPHLQVTPIEYIDGYVIYQGEGSNNVAEGYAVIDSITYVLDNLSNYNIESILIKTDSTYIIYALEAVKNHPDRDWLNMDVKNASMYADMSDIFKRLKEKDIKLNVKKVLGHSTAIGNHLADRLALLGRVLAGKDNSKKVVNIQLTENKKYWSATDKKHPLLNYRELYFMNTINGGSKGTYTIIDYKKGVDTGKKTNDALYGLVMLEEPIPSIETVMDTYNKNMGTLSLISAIDLDVLYNRTTEHYFKLFGSDIYIFNNKNRSRLIVLEENPVCTDIYPPGLAKIALDKTLHLSNIIDNYRNKVDSYTYTDITDLIYSQDSKGKYKTLLPNSTWSLPIKYKSKAGKEYKILLELGTDMISRNQLKRLEADKPIVTFVGLEKNDKQLDYFVIIENTENKDISIWCNFFSSMHIMT